MYKECDIKGGVSLLFLTKLSKIQTYFWTIFGQLYLCVFCTRACVCTFAPEFNARL